MCIILNLFLNLLTQFESILRNELPKARTYFVFILQFNSITYSLNMIMMMMNCYCGMVDRRKAFSLISSRDHCQRFNLKKSLDLDFKKLGLPYWARINFGPMCSQVKSRHFSERIGVRRYYTFRKSIEVFSVKQQQIYFIFETSMTSIYEKKISAEVRLIYAEQMSLYNFIILRKKQWTQMKTKQLKQDILNQ